MFSFNPFSDVPSLIQDIAGELSADTFATVGAIILGDYLTLSGPSDRTPILGAFEAEVIRARRPA
jgi:hypothetical protein